MTPSIFNFARYRFLWWALGLSLASTVAYVTILPPIGIRNGSSWVGYILGIAGAVLIVWLTWFGVRKRAYNASGAKLQAWLSGHVYLGSALLVIGTLHSGFSFGWNIHTLAYVLMVLVIASGLFGVYTYLRYPTMITLGRGRLSVEAMIARVVTLDRELVTAAKAAAAPATADLLTRASEEPIVGDSVWQHLRGRVRGERTQLAIAHMESLPQAATIEEALAINEAIRMLRRKLELLGRIRREYQMKALMKVWLLLHVPLATGLLAALGGHILAVFFW